MLSEGVIYLLHFDRPFKHARHYLGWTQSESVEARIARHRQGHGARLLKHVLAAGIDFELVRTWPGGRTEERRLKRQRNTKLCPICTPPKGKHDFRDTHGRFARAA